MGSGWICGEFSLSPQGEGGEPPLRAERGRSDLQATLGEPFSPTPSA